ncbi:branched-chain amino acid aminotransferase, partial [Candidatus Aerophobetes bacterium]
KIYINGKFFKQSQALISVNEGGFLFGEGLFETMRAYSGSVFRLTEHLERILGSCHFLKLPFKENAQSLTEKINQTLGVNKLFDAYLKLIISSGINKGSLTDTSSSPTLIIIAREFEPYPQRIYKEGFKAITSKIRRNPYSPLAQHKSLNFLENVLGKREAEERGKKEAIFIDPQGNLTEGATTNIFLVKQGSVISPALNSMILPGITRKVVLEISSNLGMPIEERKVELKELYEAEEAFLTNSLIEIMPLVQVDSHIIGKGVSGTLTQKLKKEYQKKVSLELSLSSNRKMP